MPRVQRGAAAQRPPLPALRATDSARKNLEQQASARTVHRDHHCAYRRRRGVRRRRLTGCCCQPQRQGRHLQLPVRHRRDPTARRETLSRRRQRPAHGDHPHRTALSGRTVHTDADVHRRPARKLRRQRAGGLQRRTRCHGGQEPAADLRRGRKRLQRAGLSDRAGRVHRARRAQLFRQRKAPVSHKRPPVRKLAAARACIRHDQRTGGAEAIGSHRLFRHEPAPHEQRQLCAGIPDRKLEQRRGRADRIRRRRDLLPARSRRKRLHHPRQRHL